ncbi:hypothetical protein ID855_14530 [Xenorhabdus sp. ZM]|uniref:hypothetical protein n=1 Tax=Xenorhabdus szentirmaii TaxID=290112 RepID=UPI0019C8F376|nr:hypothetical protein [Xenorhabdus sp. ZM]MBD2805890.1 hypothetical protein [Xenorhabdus sp. ZM]
MAFNIVILKREENEENASYHFISTSPTHLEKQHGIFEINKASGEIKLIRPAEYDEKNVFFMRASYKIITNWRNEVLPDETVWAS